MAHPGHAGQRNVRDRFRGGRGWPLGRPVSGPSSDGSDVPSGSGIVSYANPGGFRNPEIWRRESQPPEPPGRVMVPALAGPPTTPTRSLRPFTEMAHRRRPFPIQPSASLYGTMTCGHRPSDPGWGYRTLLGRRTVALHDSANGFRRKALPRTPVNKQVLARASRRRVR